MEGTDETAIVLSWPLDVYVAFLAPRTPAHSGGSIRDMRLAGTLLLTLVSDCGLGAAASADLH